MNLIQEGKKVLYVWGGPASLEVENDIHFVKQTTRGDAKVEHIDRLTEGLYSNASFDVVFLKGPSCAAATQLLILNILKPLGVSAFNLDDPLMERLANELLLNGFVNVKIESGMVFCEKPNYEVGSAMKLPPRKKTEAVASVWKVANDDADEELMDEEELLDEEDLKKPDPTSLRVCGTTGKRKACKDCACGLAEELASENPAPAPTQKSSCGSCYLGDAFRCASCPYLGMPAFKPGEKIQLELKDDI